VLLRKHRRHASNFKAFLVAGLLGSGAASAAPSDILFIVDGSGSMWGQIDSIAKIETAKSTMLDILGDVPEDALIGLMTYGTSSRESCSDVVLLNSIGASRDAIRASIGNLTPLGKTPIQTSLIMGLDALEASGSGDVPKSLVLISDGIETCDGDPCLVAASAKERGVNMKVHVVGFAVDADARAQLECIANAGGGQYFNASDTDGFARAMASVVKVSQEEAVPVVEVASEPEGPVVTEIFRDDFDGEDLADHWTVYNPDPDAYIVDGGALISVATRPERFIGDETVTNRFDLDFDLPRGDWDVVTKFMVEPQPETQEALFVGAVEGSSPVFSSFVTGIYKGSSNSYAEVGRYTRDGAYISESRYALGGIVDLTFDKPQEHLDYLYSGQELTTIFSKRGRDYFTTFQFVDPDGTLVEKATNPTTSLRGPSNISVFFTLTSRNGTASGGDSTILIDSIAINSVE
jgi:Ca-activated chloride channel family protein